MVAVGQNQLGLGIYMLLEASHSTMLWNTQQKQCKPTMVSPEAIKV